MGEIRNIIYTVICIITLDLGDCENNVKEFVHDIPNIQLFTQEIKNYESGIFDMKEKEHEKEQENITRTANVCALYESVDAFDYGMMADNWELSYYISKDRAVCFKMTIQTATPQKQKLWSEKYGDFNDTVKWNRCMFEVSGFDAGGDLDPPRKLIRRHFLQESPERKGVFENIMIEEKSGENATIIEQNADQWYAYKKLLLLRDCCVGDVAVFSKIIYRHNINIPNMTDILESLAKFREPVTNNGVLSCKREKYPTLS